MNTPEPNHARWFTEEVLPQESNLRGYLRVSFPAIRDVDDVVQESYLRIWRARAARPIQCARAFLFRVARNLALDDLRHAQASPFDTTECLESLPVVADDPGAGDALTREEKGRLLGEALAQLPDRCREIVFLHKIQGLPQRVVAEQLGVSEKTVANQVGLGVKRCERFFRRRGIEWF